MPFEQKSSYFTAFQRILPLRCRHKEKTDNDNQKSNKIVDINDVETKITGNIFSSNVLQSKKKLVVHTTKSKQLLKENQVIEEIGARLVYLTSYGGKMNFPLLRQETTIGRKDDNDIMLTDPKISKYHASISKTENG